MPDAVGSPVVDCLAVENGRRPSGGASDTVTASILCVGNELTEGKTLDRHGHHLSRVLGEMGIPVRKISLIPDERPLYLNELRGMLAESALVIVTGGLGPTSDDLTREVVAEAVGVELEYRAELWEELQRRFGGRKIAAANKRQAYIPRGSCVLANIVGTAPGFITDHPGGCVVALPGPPRELTGMVEASLLPVLKQRLGLRVEEVTRGTAFLIPESELEEALAAAAFDGAQWGTRVEAYRIAFALRGGAEADRTAMLQRLVRHFDPFRLRCGEIDPVNAAFARLREQSRVLVTAESCTGGLVAKLLTDVAGSSEILWGGVVAYSNEAKRQVLGVTEQVLQAEGAVSRGTVEAMVSGALKAAAGQASVAVAVSGVAGPGGGTEEKPVGTVWISVGGVERPAESRLFHFYGARENIRRRCAVAALLMVEDYLTQAVERDYS